MSGFMAITVFLLLADPPATDQQSFLNSLDEAYFKYKYLEAGFNGSLGEGIDLGERFAANLVPHIGEPVGYKAALTSKKNRKRFGVKQPLLGRLLKHMLLENNAAVPFPFAARPMMEGDLLVRVSDEAINSARNKKEVLASIEGVYPFLELPDLLYKPGLKLDGSAIAAINAGARYGVMGPIFLIESQEGWSKRLGRIEVEILDPRGKIVARGDSRQLMGHPLKAVLWIRDALKARGERLRRGDFLSLGAMTPPIPVAQEGRYTARYTGFGTKEPVEVTVLFDSGRN